MAEQRPLFVLLAQLLIAWTIEFDNAFEQQMPHRTTVARSPAGAKREPWLVSLAMWTNYLQFVSEDGVRVGEFARRAGLEKAEVRTWLTRLSAWWGYVVVAPDPADDRPKPPAAEWIVRPTAGGLRARRLWQALFDSIDGRWEARFGAGAIAAVRHALCALRPKLDPDLPDALPVLRYGLYTTVARTGRQREAERDDRAGGRHLPALFAQVLLAFALEFERESNASLAIGANVLRAIAEDGVRVRDLPGLTGVSKEALGMALGFLTTGEYVRAGSAADGGRDKVVVFTPKGRRAQVADRRLVARIEERWTERFGHAALADLRASLAELLDRRDGDRSRLGQGLVPHADGWRARKPYLVQTIAMIDDPARALPHYPMVLHRGGWPDGN